MNLYSLDITYYLTIDQCSIMSYSILNIHLYQLIAEDPITKDSLQNKDVYNVGKLESATENHSHKGHILPLRYIHNIITQVYLDISLKKILSFFVFSLGTLFFA